MERFLVDDFRQFFHQSLLNFSVLKSLLNEKSDRVVEHRRGRKCPTGEVRLQLVMNCARDQFRADFRGAQIRALFTRRDCCTFIAEIQLIFDELPYVLPESESSKFLKRRFIGEEE